MPDPSDAPSLEDLVRAWEASVQEIFDLVKLDCSPAQTPSALSDDHSDSTTALAWLNAVTEQLTAAACASSHVFDPHPLWRFYQQAASPDGELRRLADRESEALGGVCRLLRAAEREQGPLTFREDTWEISFRDRAVRFEDDRKRPVFRFAQELAAAGGRPVPFREIRERHRDVMPGANPTRLAQALRAAFPDLPLRSGHAGYVLDL